VWEQPFEGFPGPFYALGLVHGHWDALETNVDLLGEAKINMGIGIVVPFTTIIDATRPHMEEVFQIRKDNQTETNAPTQDAVNNDEYQRFEELARKLVNTPKPKPDRDKS
jgi:hypothetical protein